MLWFTHQAKGGCMNFKNILLPIEFNDTSKLFLKELLHTHEFSESNFYLLNVVDISDTYLYSGRHLGIPANLSDEIAEAAKQDMEVIKKEFFYEKGDSTISTHVRKGLSISEEIVSFVKNNDIDLVIMPSHARKGIQRMFLGSVTEQVLRDCPCPVLTVRNKDI